MKKTNLIITLLILPILLLTGCTSKYQTNKLPDEEKITIPTKIKKKRYYLNEDTKEEFKQYVINEFNNGVEKKEILLKSHDSNIPKNIWVQGYEIDKKRY